MDLTVTDPLAAYADVLREIEGEILYTEIIDFEADGNPELMVFTYDSDPWYTGEGDPPEVLYCYFYRNESGAPVLLSRKEKKEAVPRQGDSVKRRTALSVPICACGRIL